jgi:dipeptidyl aminopeptidase/acylaminoacyl peptidase
MLLQYRPLCRRFPLTAYSTIASLLFVVTLLLQVSCLQPVLHAQNTIYKLPPQPIADVLDALPPPHPVLSPRGDAVLLIQTKAYPSVAQLATPSLGLGGIRFDHVRSTWKHQAEVEAQSLVVRRFGVAPDDTASIRIQIPDKVRYYHQIPFSLFDNEFPGPAPAWSPDGSKIAFLRNGDHAVELWVADAATGKVQRIEGVKVCDVLPRSKWLTFQWMSDSKRLLVRTVNDARGKAPEPQQNPTGPIIEEREGTARAYFQIKDNLLQNAEDDARFEYYATSQLAMVDVTNTNKNSAIQKLGKPAMITDFEASPDGNYLFVIHLLKPFSHSDGYWAFPKSLEVWDKQGRVVKQIATTPLSSIPLSSLVPRGARSLVWQPLHPARLLWVEALDSGDATKSVEFRDKIMTLAAPFTGEAHEVCKLKHRFSNADGAPTGRFGWTNERDKVMIHEAEPEHQWVTTYLVNLANTGTAPAQKTLIAERNMLDLYGNPGEPVYELRPDGTRRMVQDGNWIYLAGAGASKEGKRPFLDKFNLTTLEKQRLFQSSAEHYEQFVGFVRGSRTTIITRRESATETPNFFTLNLVTSERTPLTALSNPIPQVTGLRKELVTYKRADGVRLSGILYLPSTTTPGTRLPLLMWAYPRDVIDTTTGQQTRVSSNQFPQIDRLQSAIVCGALHGYAVLHSAAMPVVGEARIRNDTYVEQITMNAKAAIDYLDSLGIIDRTRVGVGGHSYGGMMTANLLAHTDLFAAGFACSGVYNLTHTHFGVQYERRSYWEVRDTYIKMSALTFADRIKAPLLLVHGAADTHPHTPRMEAERLFTAVSGNGGTTRLVLLPYEDHVYSARESLMHLTAEMLDWADKYVKNAPPRGTKSSLPSAPTQGK